MKMFKKATLLVLALGTVGALAACGGKGDGGIKGETLADEAAWTQAFADTSAATNATISIISKGEERLGEFFEKGESVITAKVAEDKVYVYEKTDASWYVEEDGIVDEDEEHDEDQTYIATVDGVTMKYFKELEQDWQSYEWYVSDFSATVGFVLRWYAEFDPMFVAEMYDNFSNNGGTYTRTVKADDADYSSTVELKFVDGQLVWGKMSYFETNDYEGQTATGTEEITFTITYGNTTIGALPGEEEEPDVGGESSSAGGEIGGEDGAGEQVDAAGWATALSPADTDYEYFQSVNGVPTVTYQIDGDVIYMTQPAGERYLANEDGSYYLYSKQSGEAWMKQGLSQQEYKAEVAMIKIDWSEMFAYDSFAYNAATGCYEVASIVLDEETTITDVSVKIVDGKLSAMSYTIEEMAIVLNFNYQEVTLTPPDLNGGESGDNSNVTGEPETAASEKVDADGWAAAIAATRAADNFSVDMTMSAGFVNDPANKQSGSAKMYVADNKGYSVISNGSDVTYSYNGNVDGKNYVWDSSDGVNWTCEQQGDAIDIDGAWLIEETIPAGMTFDTVTYDEDAGAYKYVIDETDYILVKINDGKISYIKELVQEYWGDGATMEMVYVYAITSYGNATVGDLPSIEGATSGEQTVVGGTTDEVVGGTTDEQFGVEEN